MEEPLDIKRVRDDKGTEDKVKLRNGSTKHHDDTNCIGSKENDSRNEVYDEKLGEHDRAGALVVTRLRNLSNPIGGDAQRGESNEIGDKVVRNRDLPPTLRVTRRARRTSNLSTALRPAQAGRRR